MEGVERREPPVSGRIRRLPKYLFARLNAMTAEARARGVDVIDLGMGNPDRPPHPFVIEKLCEVAHDPRAHRYSMSRGIPHLRKAIARRYEESYGVSIDPETEAIATIGSKEGLTHLSFAILDEGDSILVPSPTYPIHTIAAIMAGARPVTVPIGDPADLVKRIGAALETVKPKPKVLLLCFPNNPTTATVEPGFFEEVVDLARFHDLWVIHDLAYADLVFDGYKAPSFLQAKGAKEVGVEFFSMTKSYNMAGWRVGFMVGNKDMVATLTRMKSYLDYGMFTPIQVAAIAALREGTEPCREIAEVYRLRRDIVVDGLNKMGWPVQKPRATMYVWAPLPEAFRAGGSLKFAEVLLEQAGVNVSPGIGFGEEGDGFIRIALVENDERIRQALRNIRRVVQGPGTEPAAGR